MTITAFFDGSCELTRGVWGQASYGAIVFRDGKAIWECSETFRPEIPIETSNNLAEYLGFLAVLDFLKNGAHDRDRSTILGDSRLVIMQMSGVWRIKSGAYAPFALRARGLLLDFHTTPTLKWIPRDQNQIADRLSKPQGR